MEYRLGGEHVVIAIFGDLRPKFLRNRLVPRKPQLLVVNAQLNFELFQALTVVGRREVVHVGIAHVVRLAEERVRALAAAHDALAQIVKLLVCVAHESRVQNMIVVPSAVEADQPVVHQILDFLRLRVDHPHDGIALARQFPVHQKQVWEDFHVVEHHRLAVGRAARASVVAFELHPRDLLKALVSMMCASRGEADEIGRAHV